jgi:hypothetical protein
LNFPHGIYHHIDERPNLPKEIHLTGKAAVQEDPVLELISRYRRKLSMALN